MVTVLNVALENHPGTLSDILNILGRAEINVEGVEAEAMGDFGTLRLLVSKPKLAGDLLRQDGYDVVEAEVLELDLPNKHGELARLAAKLGQSGVNIVSIFGTAPKAGQGRILMRVNDIAKAKQILGIE